MLKCIQGLDPVIRKAIAAGCGLAVVFLVIIIASFANMSHYYLREKGDRVEVWRGRFAPMGSEKLAVLPGTQMPEKPQSVYSRAEVGTLIVDNFVGRADALMMAPGAPNFEMIRGLLTDALSYVEGEGLRNGIRQRLTKIDLAALIFKADISVGKGTPTELEDARRFLVEAARVAAGTPDAGMIQEKLKAITDRLRPPTAPKAAPSPTPSPIKDEKAPASK